MTRLAAPILLGLVLVSALVGFGVGFIVGQSPSTVAASEVAPVLLGPSDAETARSSPTMEANLVGVGARSSAEENRGQGRGPELDPAAAYAPAPSAVDAAIRRTKAPEVDAATGNGVISGVVTNKAGKPVAGVEVHATPARAGMRTERAASERQVSRSRRDLEEVLADTAKEWAEGEGRAVSALSGADGTFRIEHLADLDFRVRAQAEGYSFTVRECGVVNPVQQPDAEVKIEGRALVGIRVSVVDENGAPRAKAIVVANGDRLEWTAEDPVVYSTAKQFQLQAFADPLASASQRNRAARFISEAVYVDAVAEPDRVVTLTLEAACIVTGRVLGENVTGTSWQGVYAVPVRPDEPFDATVPQPDDIQTYAQEGVFTFQDLRPGRYAICLIGSNNVPVDHEMIEVGPGLTELTLDREAHDASRYIRVHALSPRGTDVESYDVRLEYQKEGSEVSQWWMGRATMPDGTRLLDVSEFTEFDYDAWPSGCKAWAVASSSVYGKVSVPLSSAQRDVTIQFLEACELTVRLEGDISMGGFRIRILEDGTDRTEPPQLSQASQGNRRGGPRIDARGVAHFRALSPGPVIVELAQTGRWWGEGRELARQEIVLSGSDHQISMEAPPVGDLEVHLTPCSEPRYLYLVIEEDDGAKKNIGWINTTEDGRAVFRGLPAGEYTVKDSKSGASAKATVPGPELRIDLAEHVTKLSVSVTKLDGRLTEWGLVGGDLIVAIDGVPIDEVGTLMDRLHSDGVTVTVERGEETLEIEIPRYPRKTREGNPLGGGISTYSE